MATITITITTLTSLLNTYCAKFKLTDLIKTSYLNSYVTDDSNFHVISFGSEPETDKMIKTVLKSDTAVTQTLDDGSTIRFELEHEPAGRTYDSVTYDKAGNKQVTKLTANKSSNKLLINIKPPATTNDFASRMLNPS